MNEQPTIHSGESEIGRRQLTLKQTRAVQLWVANGRSKAEALREANYSEAVVRHPDRVFGSETVRQILRDKGLDEYPAVDQLKRRVHSKRLDHMAFPPFRIRTQEDEDKGINHGEQLTDEDIRELLGEVGCVVRRIVHGEMAREVYFWTDNDMAQLKALDMVFKLGGSYAPKQTERKHDHNMAVFSLASLRKKMKENGLTIIPLNQHA